MMSTNWATWATLTPIKLQNLYIEPALIPGFLTTNDEYASGNWGLFDQHLAIEFVKENIKAFKGDPDQITLAGDGSGAASVGFHLVSPVTRNKREYSSSSYSHNNY